MTTEWTTGLDQRSNHGGEWTTRLDQRSNHGGDSLVQGDRILPVGFSAAEQIAGAEPREVATQIGNGRGDGARRLEVAASGSKIRRAR